jgi:ferredoxin-NADP reductase/ferredoxin
MSISIDYQSTKIPLKRLQSVLEALEYAGIDVPNSCRAGVCHFCILKATGGQLPQQAQHGLTQSQKDQKLFLACLCRPLQSISCESVYQPAFSGQVRIREICEVATDVALVTLQKPQTLSWHAGQFITLRDPDGHRRSFPIATSATTADELAIHVRRRAQSPISGWLFDTARPRDRVTLEGPWGNRIDNLVTSDQSLMLLGWGIGLAPLYAMAQEALARGHTGKIKLIQAVLAGQEPYLQDILRSLAQRYSHVCYEEVTYPKLRSDRLSTTDLRRLGAETITDPQRQCMLICADSGLVRRVKQKSFVAGVSRESNASQ